MSTSKKSAAKPAQPRTKRAFPAKATNNPSIRQPGGDNAAPKAVIGVEGLLESSLRPAHLPPAPIRRLPITSVQRDDGLQVRVQLSEKDVSKYANYFASGVKLDPVLVFHDGEAFWLADGFHRVCAAEKNGLKEIDAEVHPGSRQEALRYALEGNVRHGVRLTNADKRKAVRLALQQWPDHCDRAIAELCGAHHQLVGTVRRELDDSSSSALRLGRDGKRRRIPQRKAAAAPSAPKPSSIRSPEAAEITDQSNGALDGDGKDEAGAESTVPVSQTPAGPSIGAATSADNGADAGFVFEGGAPLLRNTWPDGWLRFGDLVDCLRERTLRVKNMECGLLSDHLLAFQQAVFGFGMVANKIAGISPAAAALVAFDEALDVVGALVRGHASTITESHRY